MSTEKTTTPATVSTATIIKMGNKKKNDKPATTNEIKEIKSEPKVEPIVHTTETSKERISVTTMKPTVTTAKTTATSAENMTTVVPTEVQFIRSYIKNYLDMYNAPRTADRKNLMKLFSRVMIYAINNQSQVGVLNELSRFFKDNKNKILSCENALQGIVTLTPSIKEKVQVAYTLMYALATRSKEPLNYSYASDVLGNTGFVSYVKSRMPK